jgi:hypothetical protein
MFFSFFCGPGLLLPITSSNLFGRKSKDFLPPEWIPAGNRFIYHAPAGIPEAATGSHRLLSGNSLSDV